MRAEFEADGYTRWLKSPVYIHLLLIHFTDHTGGDLGCQRLYIETLKKTNPNPDLTLKRISKP